MWHDLRSLGSSPRVRRLFIARFVSNVGNGISPVALSFGVLSIPGAGATELSIVTAAQMVPIALFMLAGGVVADRADRARVVGITDIVGAFIVAWTAVMLITGTATVPLLCVAGAVYGTLNALWWPAFNGLLPAVVDREHLQAANSVIGFASNVGFTTGAAIAAAVVSTVGPGWALLADAVSFLVAGLLVWSIGGQRSAIDSPAAARQSVLTDLRDGWREFSSRGWLVVGSLTFALFNLCFSGFLSVLAPLQADEQLAGARDFGLMMAAWGAGSIAGVVVAMRVRPRRPLVAAIVLLPLLGVWVLALAVPVNLAVLFALALLSGVALDVFVVLWNTTFHRLIPDEALSRVSAYDALGATVFAPVGLVIAGPLAEALGTGTALTLMGAAVVVVPFIALTSPSLRGITSHTAAVAAMESALAEPAR